MRKADAQRAMREANYARNNPSGSSRREAAGADEAPPAPAARPSPAAAKAAKAAPSDPAAQDARCGHKSMNNRACTREAGHPEKSHRYS